MLSALLYVNLAFSFEWALFVQGDAFFFPLYFLATFVLLHAFIIIFVLNPIFPPSICFTLFGIIRLVYLLSKFQELKEARVLIKKIFSLQVSLSRLLLLSFFTPLDTTFDWLLLLLKVLFLLEKLLFLRQPRTWQ